MKKVVSILIMTTLLFTACNKSIVVTTIDVSGTATLNNNGFIATEVSFHNPNNFIESSTVSDSVTVIVSVPLTSGASLTDTVIVPPNQINATHTTTHLGGISGTVTCTILNAISQSSDNFSY